METAKITPVIRPTPEMAFDELADQYDRYFGNPHAHAEDEALFTIYKEWNGSASPDCRILDVGCGTGLFLDYALVDHTEYLGIDCSQKMLDKAQDYHPDNEFLKLDFMDIDRDLSKDPRVGGSMHMNRYPPVKEMELQPAEQLVSLFGSLSYMIPSVWVWQNIRRCLVPGGKFFIMVYGPRYKKRAGHIVNRLKIPPLSWTATARWCKTRLKAAGLVNVKYQGFHALPDKYTIPRSEKDRAGLRDYLVNESRCLKGSLANLGYFIIFTGERAL
jgi:SAM-dependent methyltransferase